MATRATTGFFIAATLLTVNAVTFCPLGSTPTNASNGTSARLSLAGQFLAVNKPLQCNGTLVAWQYCYRSTNGSAQITFQIWRPTNNNRTSFSRQQSTSFNKTFSTALGATVCERVLASSQVAVQQSDVIGIVLPFSARNTTVGVFSPNGSVSTVRYSPANSTNGAQFNNSNVTLTQLSLSVNASLMVYVELLASSSIQPSTSSASRSSSTSVSSARSSGSLSTTATYLVPSPMATVPVAGGGSNGAQTQVVAAASASSVVGVFVVVCIIVAVVMVVVCTMKYRKSATLGSCQPTDNPTYDMVEDSNPRTRYFDSSNLVKQMGQKTISTSSDRPSTPRRQADSRYLSLTVISTSEVPEYEKDPFQDPSDDVDAILRQLVDLNIHLLTKEDVTVQSLARAGQFSVISKGVWKEGSNRYQVALKALPVQAGKEERTLLLQEAAVMGQFRHPNVVSIYGVVNEQDSAMLVIEHMQQGDLDTFLRTLGPEDCLKVPHPQSTSGLLLSFCQQIALAMHYLSTRGFVHCDLAARSVFVSEDNICKVGEFGMSRRVATRKVSRTKAGTMQVRWMAPEALHHNEYTSASDVWGYGCLLYEMWSLGKMPYEECTDAEVAEKISSGWRLPPPPGCPRHIYKIMVECWNPDSATRPSFRDILSALTQDQSQIMAIPKEDARTHPKAGTLGGNLQAGRLMYEDLQCSYTSAAGPSDDVYENVTRGWHNKGTNDAVPKGTNDGGPDELYEGMDSSAAEGMNSSAGEGMGSLASKGSAPEGLYEGANDPAAAAIYDSVNIQDEPTYDSVQDSMVDRSHRS